ncbi:MAG: response regulator [Lachnospiraceae bacterium]|nr:response regulator [Lachnospiraceae bacterium]
MKSTNLLIILLAAFINLIGRWVSINLRLPVLLDSIGTFLSSILLGPVAGALSGVIMNLVTAIEQPELLWFSLVAISGAVCVGLFFPRNTKADSFSIISVAMFAGFVMSIIQTPINMIVYEGYTGNLWGDALIDMLHGTVNSRAVCCILGGLFVNMPDKVISLYIAVLIRFLMRLTLDNYRAKHKYAEEKNNIPTALILLGISGIIWLSAGMDIQAESNRDPSTEYASVIYGMDNGLVSLEINTVAQTDDGFIWAGAYSGLYRYNGTVFEQIQPDERISNVIYLFTDNDGLLWIGTNDSGVARYDTLSGDITLFTTSEGLPSNSIRSICSDFEGNIYVSTAKEPVKIDKEGNVYTYSEYEDLNRLYTLKKTETGSVIGVTYNGTVAEFLQDDTVEYLYDEYGENDPELSYTALDCSMAGDIMIGTSGNKVYHIDHKSGELKRVITIEGLNYVNNIVYDPVHNGFFVCASTEIAFIDQYDRTVLLGKDGFNNAVNDAIVDYQGNIWFASTKQGVMKISYDPFYNVLLAAGLDEAAVNALLIVDDVLYAGTDTGLIRLNTSDYSVVRDDDISERFDGERIRHLMRDSLGNIWVSTYGTVGLACIRPDGTVFSYSSVIHGLLGSRFRFTLELKNGSILAASNEGLNFIYDGSVKKTIGIEDGLSVPQILSCVEREDGSILAGSDGGGVYVIKDGEVTAHFGAEEGLNSQVILRIVPYGNGYIYVTSNGLYYDGIREEIRRLRSFPYNNNYDIYITGDGVAWISSSAGIYVAKASQLIKDRDYNYQLLNHITGFDTSLTANAWNATDGDELYLCCSDGVRRINTVTYDEMDADYNIVINDITFDDDKVDRDGDSYILPSGKGRVSITPAVLSYTLDNPLIEVDMIGDDVESVYMRQSEVASLQYSSLPYGDYELKVSVVDEIDGSTIKEKTFKLYKGAELYERVYFKVYLIFVGVMLVAFLAWMIAKMSNMAIINRQYDQIREAKEEAEYANKAKSQFLANMSHEIRTPINAVLGMDEMILRESTEEPIKDYASDIYTAGNTLLSLINDILDSSKIESGKMEIVPVEYELSVLIRDLFNMISQRARDKALKLVVEVCEDLPKGLYGDDVRIRQVVTNILTNAVKYTHEGTVTMRVSGKKKDNGVLLRFEVEDTGIGIKEEDIPKLFEDFRRIEEGRNRNIEGTGLGMSITMRLLNMMGSKLEVKSEYGVGSTFWFDIHQGITNPDPVGKIDTGERQGLEYSYSGSFTAPDAHILVVDDNDMNRKVFKSLLKPTQIKISEADRGEKSLELAGSEIFDMVFMDHMMPDMDGVETMQIMRTIEGYDRIPIYVLTANAVTGAKEMYIEAGFDGFISKPVVSEKLEAAILNELPNDKVKPYEGSIKEEYNDNNKTQGKGTVSGTVIADEMPVVEGLDWNYAWMHLPDKDLICSMLSDFECVADIQADKLDSMYLRITGGDAGAVDDYRIQVHGMKSSAATVGIVPLAGMAKILEFAAKDNDIHIIGSLHDIFIKEWRSYKEKLRVFTDEDGSGNEPGNEKELENKKDKQEADRDMIFALLDMLSQAMTDFDVDVADETVKKMRSYSYPDNINDLFKKLYAAVGDLDTDESERIIEEIKESVL